MDTKRMQRPRVVVVGCGFGGLAATRSLASAHVDVTVIDRQNHHLFQPLLYQVASAGLNPSDIAQPIRHVLRKQRNSRIVLGEVVDIDLDISRVRTGDMSFEFDYLVLAAGATHSYFGNDEWPHHAPGLKSLDDALDIRRRILMAFERAELTTDLEERERLMTFIIVGGGPTGVELAGAIKEIATNALRDDFRTIDTRNSRVVLVEAAPRVLGAFTERLSSSALAQLRELGVEVCTSNAVTRIDDHGVVTTAGNFKAATVLWAAGVAASPLGALASDNVDRVGKVVVNDDLTVDEHSNVFAIGDLASANFGGGKIPGVAPAAIQGGNHAAACIIADLEGVERPQFHYRDKGSMATIGRSKAVVHFSDRIEFGGLVAWVLWWSVHIITLIDFRSRTSALLSWGWQYITGQRIARLITGYERSSTRGVVENPEAGSQKVPHPLGERPARRGM